MIKNKRTFMYSMIILVVTLISLLQFPNNHSLGEELFLAIGLPIVIFGGLHTVGIILLILLITGIILFRGSLAYYRTRLTILAIVLIFSLPSVCITLYQSTFAKGIYTIGYESEESSCEFEMINDKTLGGECTLYLKNYSNKQQTFTITFHEHYPEDTAMFTLMNDKQPLEITLQPKEQRVLSIDREIDVTHLTNYIEGGNGRGIPITIEANGKSRQL